MKSLIRAYFILFIFSNFFKNYFHNNRMIYIFFNKIFNIFDFDLSFIYNNKILNNIHEGSKTINKKYQKLNKLSIVGFKQ